MMTLAVRAAPVFGATTRVTVPESVPLAGVVLIQLEALDAVQPHDDRLAVTVTVAVVPAAGADNEPADSAYEHDSALCVTVKV
jgi:hypothetical protein